MEVVWRVRSSDILHGINSGPMGFRAQPHTSLFRRTTTLSEIAGWTGRRDIFPCCPTTHTPGGHMVKGQFPPVTGNEATILTSKTITQKQVESCETGKGPGGDIFFQRYDTGQFYF